MCAPRVEMYACRNVLSCERTDKNKRQLGLVSIKHSNARTLPVVNERNTCEKPYDMYKHIYT